MYALLVIVHIIVSIILIVTVLLQAGKGGGLSGLAAGGSLQTAFGAEAGDVMKKATSATAVIFMVTSLSLAFISAQRGASVVANITPEAQATENQKPEAQGGPVVKKKTVKIDPETGKQIEVEEDVQKKSAIGSKVKGMIEKFGEATAPKEAAQKETTEPEAKQTMPLNQETKSMPEPLPVEKTATK